MQLSFARILFQWSCTWREAGIFYGNVGWKGGNQNLLYDCFPVTFQAASELFQNFAALGNVRSIPIRNRIVVHTNPMLLVGVYKVWYSVFYELPSGTKHKYILGPIVLQFFCQQIKTLANKQKPIKLKDKQISYLVLILLFNLWS